jgi:hypothetical protein
MATLNGNKGLYKGSPSTGQKYVHKMCLTNFNSSCQFTNATLYDYVAYVPFIDLDVTDEQEVVTIDLPRFADGNGLRVLAVSQGAGTGNTDLTMTYINQDGVEQVATTTLDAAQGAGSVITTGQVGDTGSTYMRFAQGDYGIRKITKVQCSAGVGAICALVIVKPLCVLNFSEVNTASEVDYLADKGGLIPIHNDSYLNLCMFNTYTSTATPNMVGYLQTVWEGS